MEAEARRSRICQSLKKLFLQEKTLRENLRAPFVGLFDGLSGQIANYKSTRQD